MGGWRRVSAPDWPLLFVHGLLLLLDHLLLLPSPLLSLVHRIAFLPKSTAGLLLLTPCILVIEHKNRGWLFLLEVRVTPCGAPDHDGPIAVSTGSR